MFWRKRIFRILAFIVIFILTLLLMMVRSDGDISCLYAGF